MYKLIDQIMERMKVENPEATFQEVADAVRAVLTMRWKVGYKDRGLGHGDFAVTTTDGLVIVECPGQEFADHICKLHNETLGFGEEKTYRLEVWYKKQPDGSEVAELFDHLHPLGGELLDDNNSPINVITFEFVDRLKAVAAGSLLKEKGKRVEGPIEV